jgi:hypothetical protein
MKEQIKLVQKLNEPTGLIKEYRIWKDDKRIEHKDISSSKIACLNCSPI